MGDPPRLKNKYERPKMLWEMERLSHEKGLKKEYGLKNMRELWIALAELKKYRREARRLLSVTEEERARDSGKILTKLELLGMLKKGSGLDDVLSLSVRDFLERRLQTLVLRKGLARSMTQSRQLITHGFVSLQGRKVTAPGYIVDSARESTLAHARPIDIEVKVEDDGPKEAPKAEEAKAEGEAPAA
jgi:small subunit ribosomal protein S4